MNTLIIKDAKAVCSDCNGNAEGDIKGSLTISVAEWFKVDNIGMARGELILRCGQHHDIKRMASEGSFQHNTFNVVDSNGDFIGVLDHIPSEAIEKAFTIENEIYAAQYRDILKSAGREYRF